MGYKPNSQSTRVGSISIEYGQSGKATWAGGSGLGAHTALGREGHRRVEWMKKTWHQACLSVFGLGQGSHVGASGVW